MSLFGSEARGTARVPHYLQVDLVVAVHKDISHVISEGQRYVGVCLDEFWCDTLDIATCLSADGEVADNSILNELIGKELGVIKPRAVTRNTIN